MVSKKKLCKAIENELKCDIEMRIAVTLHRSGITSEEWNDFWKDTDCYLPEPANCAIMNYLRCMERNIAIVGWGSKVNKDEIPDILEIKMISEST